MGNLPADLVTRGASFDQGNWCNSSEALNKLKQREIRDKVTFFNQIQRFNKDLIN